MPRWLATARTILATAAITSAAWLIGGSLWVQRERAEWMRRYPPPRAAAPGPLSPPPAAAGALVIPVAGVAIGDLADTFSQARAEGARVHDAIDIVAPRGTPVIAAAAGELEKLFLSHDGGNTIYVRSPDRTTIYYYAHLDSYAPGLAEHQQVRAGQPLGTVGTTGNADPAAPHLHFAIGRTTPSAGWSDPTTALNPYPLLITKAAPGASR